MGGHQADETSEYVLSVREVQGGMAPAAGTRFGSYEITGELGAGGMGEVYRATDTTLEREVAIKMLPQSFAADTDRIARFEQEAKLLASLNHTNIAQVYGLEKGDGATAIIMELVEGPTLADRIEQGPIPVREALDIAMQIIEALDAAHGQGIVHRDLKPANIKLKPDGTVKVLDFGIAKAFEPSQFLSGPSSPVMTTPVTQAGIILGTAAYMSPEQARGKPVDQRTDVWAFGCVLCEMLTGQPVFGGEDVTITLARVLERDTDLRSLPDSIPATVRHGISLCLQKNPKERLHAIGDVRLALQGAFETTSSPGAEMSARRPFWLRPLPLVAAGVIAGAAIVAVYAGLGTESPAEVRRIAEVLPDGRQFTGPSSVIAAVSPDGSQVVYTATGQLFLRNLSDWEARPVAGTDEVANSPFFSPDGQWIGFRSVRDQQLKRIAVTGGAPITLAPISETPLGQPFWSDDGTIIWADSRGIMRVGANGGEPEPIAAVSGPFFIQPQLLPDGESLLFQLGASYADGDIVVRSLATGEDKVLFPGTAPAYIPTGHVVYIVDGVLLAVPFDVDSLTVTGGPVPLVEGIQSGAATPMQYAVSDSGTLAYIPGSVADATRSIGLVDRAGDVEFLDLPPKAYASPRISPDGRTLLVQSIEPSGGIIWSYDLSGDSAIQQMTFEGDSHRPVWSREGQKIAFSSDRDGTMSLYWMPADGSAGAERLTTAEERTNHWMGSWSADDETIVFNIQRELATDWDIWLLSLDDGETTSLYDMPNTGYFGAELSHDGQWLAYGAGQSSAALDIYIEPFPPTGSRRRISQAGGGYWPLWSPDDDELFYRPVSTSSEVTLRSVDIVLEPNFGFSNERTHAVRGFQVVSYYRDYDLTPDGERLVMLFPSEGTQSDDRARINIVTNWFEEVKARVPVP